MPLVVGLGVVRSLNAIGVGARIVVLAVAGDEREIRVWSEAGVLGFVGGGASMTALCDVTLAVAHGEVSFSSDVVGVLFQRTVTGDSRGESRQRAGPRLTQRELEVLELLSRGMSNKQIGQTLGVEVSTAKNHAQNIFRKLGVHRRAETTAWADTRRDS